MTLQIALNLLSVSKSPAVPLMFGMCGLAVSCAVSLALGCTWHSGSWRRTVVAPGCTQAKSVSPACPLLGSSLIESPCSVIQPRALGCWPGILHSFHVTWFLWPHLLSCIIWSNIWRFFHLLPHFQNSWQHTANSAHVPFFCLFTSPPPIYLACQHVFGMEGVGNRRILDYVLLTDLVMYFLWLTWEHLLHQVTV